MSGLGIYQLHSTGSPVGEGVTGTQHLTMFGYGKPVAAAPYLAANEYVAHQIGTRLGLPLPPGGFVSDGTTMFFATMSFRAKGASTPPVIPAHIAAAEPDLAAGIVVLDLLVANSDRHQGNLSYSSHTARLEVFDHSHAVFGHVAKPTPGSSALAVVVNDFVIDGCSAGRPGNRQCLLDVVDDPTALKGWCDEASAVLTDRFIARVASELVSANLIDPTDSGVLTGALMARRNCLRTLLKDNATQFKSIAASSWGML